MQKNNALEIFTQQLNEMVKLTEIFQSVPASIKNLSSDEIANLSNDFLPLDMKVKLTVASNFLTFLLGRPPTIKELAKVTDEAYFKIYRFIKKTDVFLPYVIRRRKSSEIRELQRVVSISGLAKKESTQIVDLKTFVWKGPGIHTARTAMDSGRPSIFPVFMLSPLIDTLQLTRTEKDKFLTYLASPPHVDAMKRLTVEHLKFFLKVLDTDLLGACEKILPYSLSAMWERAAKIAKRKKLAQKEELEKLPLDGWVASINTEEFKHGLYQLIREIGEMPEEAFASNCIIPAFKEGLDIKGYVSAAVNDKALLRCTRCLCKSPIRISSEVVTCAFCGQQYLSEIEKEKS